MADDSEILFVGETFKTIRMDTTLNISAATVKKILYKKPDGTTGFWTATLEGTTVLTYQPIITDLDVKGLWKLQAYVEIAGKKGYSIVSTQEVRNELE